MRLTIFKVFLIILFLINNLITFGQINDKLPFKPDTISETIVFEYDTVYLAPDTLKQVDTIVHYQQLKHIKSGSSNTFKFLESFNLLKGLNDHWSLGVGFNTYTDKLFKKGTLTDSISVKRFINYSFEVHINYKANRWKYSLGFGYTPLHEQFQYQKTKGLNSAINNNSYDSLQITSKYLINNYYHYLNAFVNIGRKWGNGNVHFILNSTVICDILIDASALYPYDPPLKINSSSIDKIKLKLGINPCVGFKILKDAECSIGPFFNYSVLNPQKYPVVNQFIVGAGIKIQ